MTEAVAIIPARGGSKRIPRKNIKLFDGKPIIAYSIQTAIDSELFDRIIVTTDDDEIAEVAIHYGAEVPFIRPKELADDHTGTFDVVEHALKWLKEHGDTYTYSCTIYATAPFLQARYLVEGYEKLKTSDAIIAFSCTSMPYPIQRTFRLTEDGRCEMFWPENYSVRSQDLEEAYQDAGQFYWSRVGRNLDIMFSHDSIPIVIPQYLVQDIDTQDDWHRAELMHHAIKTEKFKHG